MNIYNIIIQGILVIAYIIGVFVIIHFQSKKIDALKTRIESQSGLLSDVNTVRQILDPKVYREYVEMMEDKFKLQAEQDKEKIKKDMEANAKKSVDYLMSKYLESIKFNIQLIASFPNNPSIDDFLKELPDGMFKDTLLEARKEAVAQWNAFFPDPLNKDLLLQTLLEISFKRQLINDHIKASPRSTIEAGAPTLGAPGK
jgi:hypothetical protein